MEKINSIFIIKQMLENNSFDREQLLKILESFQDDIPVVPILLLQDQKVLRTRSNEDDFFGFVHELSYPPAEFARTDRASLNGAPMFYATAFTKNVDNTHAYPRIVSALETMTLLRTRESDGVKCMTQSVWHVKKPIHLFAFPFSNKYKRACEEIGVLNAGWESLVCNNHTEEAIEFFSYIGDMMAETNVSCLYNITATCVDYILTHFNFDGVIYPSVPVEGQGLNICLKPSIVDENIEFAGAVTEIIFKNGDKSRIETLANAKMIDSNSFEWIITDEGKAWMLASGVVGKDVGDKTIVVRSQTLFAQEGS